MDSPKRRDDTQYPSICAKHPKAKIRHEYEQTFINGAPGRTGAPVEKTLGYFCAECGAQLCSPEEYSRRDREGGHFDSSPEQGRRVCIRYWHQETIESGGWRYTDPMTRATAEKLLETGVYDNGAIEPVTTTNQEKL
jgi:hypothetical protein